MYTPLTYNEINLIEGNYTPSGVLNYDNYIYRFWCRSLFQRAASVFKWILPDEWQGNVKNYLLANLYAYGYVAVFERDDLGIVFSPTNLQGLNFYRQPTHALITNHMIPTGLNLEIGVDCELLQLTPDYHGIYDIISYHAEKLACMDSAINMSIINSKFAWLFAAKNKTAAQAFKIIFDQIQEGKPAVFFDKAILNDGKDKSEPYQFVERMHVKESYIVSDLLQDFQTILNNFDSEIGIPTVPYAKKERMVTSEADSRFIDSSSRSSVWYDCLKSSIDKIHSLYPELQLDVSKRYNIEGGVSDGKDNLYRDV